MDDEVDDDQIWKMFEALKIEIPPEEIEIVKSVLDKFAMMSEDSSQAQIDLRLTLMALPH